MKPRAGQAVSVPQALRDSAAPSQPRGPPLTPVEVCVQCNRDHAGTRMKPAELDDAVSFDRLKMPLESTGEFDLGDDSG